MKTTMLLFAAVLFGTAAFLMTSADTPRVEAQEGSGSKEGGDGPAPEEPPAMTAKEQVAYSVGVSVGEGFQLDGLDVDLESLLKGIRDGMERKKPRLPRKVMNRLLAEYQRQAGENRLKRILSVEKEWFAQNAKQEGVVSLPSGLQYQVIRTADGPKPQATSTVTVHYHGTLVNGAVFDSSLKRGRPATFPLNRVIRGWTEGLQLMSVGAKWKFFIPSHLAYGPRSPSPKIKPHSTLVFVVELLKIG